MFFHGHACKPFRDANTMCGDTLVETYERTMSRLEKMSREEYQAKIEWECEFDDAGSESET